MFSWNCGIAGTKPGCGGERETHRMDQYGDLFFLFSCILLSG